MPPNDIVKNMRPDYSDLPVGDPSAPFLSPLRQMGRRLAEWKDPKQALRDRLQFYGKKLADPEQAIQMFGPQMGMTYPQFHKAWMGAAERIANQRGMTGAARANLYDVMKSHLTQIDPASYKRLGRIGIHTPKTTSAQGLYFNPEIVQEAGMKAVPKGQSAISLGTHSPKVWQTGKHELTGHEIWDRLRNMLPQRSEGRRAMFLLDSFGEKAKTLRDKFRALAKKTKSESAARQLRGFGYMAYRLIPEEEMAFSIPRAMASGLSQEQATRQFMKDLPHLAKSHAKQLKMLQKRYDTWEQMVGGK